MLPVDGFRGRWMPSSLFCFPSMSLVVEAVGIVDYPRVGERGCGLSKRCGNLGKGDGRASRDFHIAAISIALVP